MEIREIRTGKTTELKLDGERKITYGVSKEVMEQITRHIDNSKYNLREALKYIEVIVTGISEVGTDKDFEKNIKKQVEVLMDTKFRDVTMQYEDQIYRLNEQIQETVQMPRYTLRHKEKGYQLLSESSRWLIVKKDKVVIDSYYDGINIQPLTKKYERDIHIGISGRKSNEIEGYVMREMDMSNVSLPHANSGTCTGNVRGLLLKSMEPEYLDKDVVLILEANKVINFTSLNGSFWQSSKMKPLVNIVIETAKRDKVLCPKCKKGIVIQERCCIGCGQRIEEHVLVAHNKQQDALLDWTVGEQPAQPALIPQQQVEDEEDEEEEEEDEGR